MDITPNRAIPIAGMMKVRHGEYAQSPLTVNSAAFESDGVRVVLCSCDLLLLPGTFVRQVQADCAERYQIDSAAVIIACTHTHQAPCTVDFFPGEVCQEFITSLHRSLVEVTGLALNDLQDVSLFSGKGWLDQMGYNRRGLKPDDTAEMNYGSWNDDFAGLEGPRDGDATVIWACDLNDSVKLVIPSFATHPTAALGSFYGADIVGALRAFLHKKLGEGVVVVYLTGAAGNTAQKQLDSNTEMAFPWRGTESLDRAGSYLGSEIVSVIARSSEPMANPLLDIAQTTLTVPIRPWPEQLDPDTLEPGFREYYTEMSKTWPRILATESPVDVHLNVIRLGDTVICTNPAELYVEHGLAIKKNSPARITLISELTDGYVGYVPTQGAFARGGYSTWPALSSKLATNAGDAIVEETLALIHKLFQAS